MTPKHILTDSRGAALVAVLLLMGTLVALLSTAMGFSNVDMQVTGSFERGTVAFYTAKAGIAHAQSVMGDGSAFDTFLVGADGMANTADDGVLSFGQSVPFGSGAYQVLVTDNDDGDGNLLVDADQRVLVTSTGRMIDAKREVRTVVAHQSAFRFCVFGDDDVDLRGGTRLDSYNSDDGPYPNGPGDEGHVGSNEEIGLDGGVTMVNGDAIAGGLISDPHHNITGDIKTGAAHNSLRPVPVCGPPYSDGTGITGGEYDLLTGVLETGAPPSNITLNAGTYCFSSINLSANRQLSPNGQVLIFLTDQTDLRGGSVTNPAGNPGDLRILSSYANPNTGIWGVEINGNAQARFLLYAPQSNILVSGNSTVYGAVIGHEVRIPGGASIHCDQALGDIAGFDSTQRVASQEIF